jgi:hypothetical protein
MRMKLAWPLLQQPWVAPMPLPPAMGDGRLELPHGRNPSSLPRRSHVTAKLRSTSHLKCLKSGGDWFLRAGIKRSSAPRK